MSYIHRLATLTDVSAITPLLSAFFQERVTADPSLTIKSDYDFSQYLTHQLKKSNSFCLVLEDQQGSYSSEIVGFFLFFAYDESPPNQLADNLRQQCEKESPFVPRRVGSTIGMYLHPEHRQPQAIQQLVLAGIDCVEQLKVNDIDVLISSEQTGIQALLERLGFVKAAVQYTRHYNIPTSQNLPNLHPPHPDLLDLELPTPTAIPLRDPETNELVKNLHGETVFLLPLRDEAGELILSSSHSPIYPIPLRNPATNQWVFNTKGELVVSPVLLDEQGQVFEYQGIPQFHPPVYQFVDNSIFLQQDEQGNYLFSDVERDTNGNIIKSLEKLPVFKSTIK
jgi:hypothetical protein